ARLRSAGARFGGRSTASGRGKDDAVIGRAARCRAQNARPDDQEPREVARELRNTLRVERRHGTVRVSTAVQARTKIHVPSPLRLRRPPSMERARIDDRAKRWPGAPLLQRITAM